MLCLCFFLLHDAPLPPDSNNATLRFPKMLSHVKSGGLLPMLLLTTHLALLLIHPHLALAHPVSPPISLTLRTDDTLGFACSDSSCHHGIESFPGPPVGNPRLLPAYTAGWFAVEFGGKVCREGNGVVCSDCDYINETMHCYGKGPYHHWCAV